MNAHRAAWEVARWEFGRYFKPRQQLVGLVLTLVGAGVGFGVASLGKDDDPATVEVAVIGAEQLPLAAAAADGARVRLTPRGLDDAEALEAAVGRGELAGLLRIDSRDDARVLVRERAGWTAELQATLSAARQQQALTDASLRPETLASVLAPVRLQVDYHELGRPPRRGGETVGVTPPTVHVGRFHHPTILGVSCSCFLAFLVS